MSSSSSTRSFFKASVSILLSKKPEVLKPLFLFFRFISQIQILTCSLIFSVKYLSIDQREYIGKSTINILKAFILDESIYLTTQHSQTFELLIFLMLIFFALHTILGTIIGIYHLRRTKVPEILTTSFKILFHLQIDAICLPMLSLQYSMITYAESKTMFKSAVLTPEFLYDTGVILITLNLINTFFGSIFNFDPWIYEDMEAARPSSLGVIDFFLKVEIYIGFAISQPVVSRWVTLFLQVILLSTKLYILLNKYPYFHFRQSLISFGFTVLTFESCLINIILAVSESSLSLSATYIWIILSPAFVSLAYKIMKNRVVATLEMSSKGLNSYRSLQKYSALQHIFDHGSFSFRTKNQGITKTQLELQFSAIVYSHRKSCFEESCFCHIFDSKDMNCGSIPHLEDLEAKLSTFSYQYIKKFLEMAIANNPKNNIWLKITLIQHIINKRPDQAVVALSVLHSINQTKISFFESYVLEKIIEKIQYNEIVRSKGEGYIDLASIVYYKDDVEAFRKKLGAVTEMTIGFWDILQSGTIKVSHILNLAQTANNEDDKLRGMWERLKARHSAFLFKDYLVYSAYLTIIRNCEKEGRSIFKNFEKIALRQNQNEKIFDKISSKNLHDDKNLFLTVNLSKRSLGTIKQVQGKGALDIVGWDHADLQNSSINMIIPPHYREKHDNMMINHLDNGSNANLQTNLLVYALKKSGYVNPVYMYITMADNITKELNYAVVLRSARLPYETLLIWKDGKIVNSTEKLAEELKTLDKGFPNLKLSDICVEFHDIYKVYLSISSLRKNKKFENFRDLSYNKILDSIEELARIPNFVVPKSQSHLDSMIEMYTICTERTITLTFQNLIKAKTQTAKSGVSFNCKFAVDPRDSEDIVYLHLWKTSTKSLLKSIASPVAKVDRKRSKFSQHEIHDDTQKSFPELSAINRSSFLKPKLLKDSSNRKQQDSFEDSAFLSQADEGLSDGENFDQPILNDLTQKTADIVTQKETSTKNIEDAILKSVNSLRNTNKKSTSSNNTMQNIKRKLNETEFEFDETGKEDDEDSVLDGDEVQLSKAGSEDAFYDLIKTGNVDNSMNGSRAQSVSSVGSTRTEMAQIIHMPARDSRMRVIFLILSIYFISITTAFIVFTNLSRTLVETASSASTVIGASTLRVFNLIELDRRVRCSNLVHRGFLPKFKSGRGVSDYSLFCLLKALNHANSLQNLTNLMTKSISDLDYEMLPELKETVQLIPLNKEDVVLNVTLDGAIASIISATIRLLKTKKVTATNPDMQFILKNVLNDILYHSEKIPEALFNYTKSTNQSIIDYLEIITILVSVITVSLVVVSILIEMKFVKEKRFFLTGIIQMDEKYYTEHIHKIRLYMKLIKDQGVVTHNNGVIDIIGTVKKREQKSIRINRVSFHGFSLNSYVRIISLVTSLIIILLIQIIMLGLFKNFDSEFVEANKNLITSDSMLIHYSLTFAGMYEYISENMTSTIRNLPITKEINYELDFLKSNSDFFKIFYDSNGQITDQDVLTILNGDLCVRYAATLSSPTLCPGMANGAGQRGLKSINSYLLATFDAMKYSYDYSAKQVKDQNVSLNLNMLRESETIMGNSFITPYAELDSILKRKVSNRLNEYRYETTVINAIAIVIGILIILLVNQFVYKHVLRERYQLKRVLSLIPASILEENGKLKVFLKNSTEYL